MRNHFTRDAGDSERAPATPVTPSARATRRDSLIETHGALVGEILFDAEVKARHEAAERLRELQARLELLNQELERKMAAGAARLAPLHVAMDAAYAKWMQACQVLERQRVANQSELVPLQTEIAELIGEINTPVHHSRMKQWRPAPENCGTFARED